MDSTEKTTHILGFLSPDALIFISNKIIEDRKKCFTGVLILLCSIIFLWRRHYRNYPPGPWSLPVVGYLGYFRKKSHVSLSNLKDRYGDVCSFKVGKFKFLMISSYDGILEGLNMQETTGRPDFYSSNSLYLGKRQRGVLTADIDDKVGAMKDFLNEGFSISSRLSQFEQKISEEAINLSCYLLQIGEAGRPFDPAECLQFSHLHIMLNIVYNRTSEYGTQSLEQIFKTLKTRFDAQKSNLYNFFPLTRSFHREHFDEMICRTKALLTMQHELLNQHKDTYDPCDLRDLTDELLNFIENDRDCEQFGNEDMDFLLMSIFESGFGAVPALLQWLIGYMVMFPEIQTSVQDELQRVVGNDRCPTISDYGALPVTTAVILEVHRITTIYPFLMLHRTTKNCIIQGYDIPKDTLLLFNVWSLHHDERYWKNPMKFNPNRFLDANQQLDIPEHFLPFGTGVRKCPAEGLVEIEVFLIFSYLLHHLTFYHDKSLQKPFKLEPQYDLLVAPKTFQICVKQITSYGSKV